MWDLIAPFFGPLDIYHCKYFLLISILFFILLVIALFADIFWVIKNYKILNFRLFAGAIIMAFNLFIAYFVNRLLYTMCLKSHD